MEDHPALEARKKSFENHLIVERGMSRTTARMRSAIVRQHLRVWKTLNPTKEQIQRAKEQFVLDGYHRDYVGNICLAFKDYGRFIGTDLAVKPPSPEKTRVPRFLTEQEVQSILFVIDSIRDRALFYVMAYTGLRVAELCSLKRDDVSFDRKQIVVQLGKGGKSAEVPIAQAALDALSGFLRAGLRPEGPEWLFPGPTGEKLSTQRLRVLCRAYGRKAGVQKVVSPHMFRHALATNLLSKGCPLPFVQRQLRHSRIETTMRYLHLSDAALRENYERFLPNY
ncbi:MAG: phage integrase family protein [Euryarchaeota archaeon]|nr:phage integrase family protein [Euryarchaeota archaeon]